MKIYGCQFDIEWENRAANHARVLQRLEADMPEAGSLLVLPEMFATGFSMNVGQTADDARESRYFLAALAAKFEIYIVAGMAVSGETKARNEAVVFGPDGREIARYAKLHPFSYSGENEHYEAGNEITFFDWNGFRVAPFICYDLRFPEIFRAATKHGAEVFVVIANWPASREGHWLTLLQARAIENQAYVVGVNRCGDDAKLHYSGRSLVVSPRGEILADAGNMETLFRAQLNHEELLAYRSEFPVLDDMRDDFLRAKLR